MKNILSLLFLLSMLLRSSTSYNVLVFFPYSSRSHFNLYSSLFTHLASKEHNVTVVSYFPLKTPIRNYRDVVLGDNVQEIKEFINFGSMRSDGIRKYTYFNTLYREFYERICNSTFESKSFGEFIKEDNKFDLILMQYFMSDCFMGLVKNLNASYIGKLLITLFMFYGYNLK